MLLEKHELDYTEIFRPEMGRGKSTQCRLSMENKKPGIKDFAISGWLPWQQEVNVDTNGEQNTMQWYQTGSEWQERVLFSF